MTEFDTHYSPVTRDNVLDFNPEAGIIICGFQAWGRVRPYEISRRAGHNYLRVALADGTLDVGFAVSDFGSSFGIPGLCNTSLQAMRIVPGTHSSVSMEYYKATSGGREKTFRDVQIAPGEVSIGYGVHHSHRGTVTGAAEVPTFYLRGLHTGYSQPDDVLGELLPGEPVDGDPVTKNFSMPRIRFLIGDPVLDETFRERWGLATIPGVEED